MTIFRSDLERWFGQPLVSCDQGEKAIRDAALAMAIAILENTESVPGFDQEQTLVRIQEACLLACASRRNRQKE